MTPKLPNDDASERRLVNASSQQQYMIPKLMHRPDIRKSFWEISWGNIWNLCAKEFCVSALRTFYSSVWESVRVYTTGGLWEIRGVKVREWERRERENLGGNRRAARSASHSAAAPVCCASDSQLFFPSGSNSRSAEGCSLEGAELCHPRKFWNRCVGTSPRVCEWWRTFGRRLRIELGDAQREMF